MQTILKNFLFLLLLLNNNLLAQIPKNTEELYSDEYLKAFDIYNKAVFNSIEQTIDFKSFTEKCNISINYYDLKKSNSFIKPDSVLYKNDFGLKQKLVVGFGKFLPKGNIDILKIGFRNNDILFIFYTGEMYLISKIPNSTPDEYFKIYKFNTKSMIYNKEIPIALIVDKNANISQTLLNQILAIQETKLISKQIISNILKNSKSLKIITYKLKKI